jgi:3-isopropylmalate/(R)-2-methylmalate dehydratase small subunit
VTIDVEASTIILPDGTHAEFPLDAFSRHCLLHGVDRLGYLLEAESDIASFERAHAATPRTIETLA